MVGFGRVQPTMGRLYLYRISPRAERCPHGQAFMKAYFRQWSKPSAQLGFGGCRRTLYQPEDAPSNR